MAKENLNDLTAFVAVARAKSFTRAAAQLGVSQSALSQTIRELEARLGVQLISRTTRSVAATESGERLLITVAPRLEEIEAELSALRASQDKPAGTIRITTPGHAADSILLPKLARVLPDYPDLKVDITTDYTMVDIVEQRFDAGVRIGDQIAKDMIALRIGPDLPVAVVGSPAYFERHAPPRAPGDLVNHTCINFRMPTYGQLHVWEFSKGKRKLNVRVEGQVSVNSPPQQIEAALKGLGLAYLLKDGVQEHIDQGGLRSVLADWCPTLTGYHLYYPSRRQSPAFALLVDTLRYKK
ncbi:LysR substrate-binding domain-containing protein [Massilia niabensis]|uniref:LysR substrate-binding domain-containing protein n=1 Tax=Massilia niabensis TaxID=544910 RepID=A0ABW0L1I6_9BURK